MSQVVKRGTNAPGDVVERGREEWDENGTALYRFGNDRSLHLNWPVREVLGPIPWYEREELALFEKAYAFPRKVEVLWLFDAPRVL